MKRGRLLTLMVFSNKYFILIGIVFISTVLYSRATNDSYLHEWDVFARKHNKEIIQWLKCTARAELDETACKMKLMSRTPQFYGKLGLFITLLQGKKVRGCYGAFYHSVTGLEQVLRDYLKGALYRDNRHKPLEAWELKKTEFVITVTTVPVMVKSIWTVDLHRNGVTIACDGKRELVFVPAEVKSSSYLSSYIKDSCQVSVFRAVTIRQ